MDTLWNKVKPASDDNMIPLINIVFLLLIFFMVAGQMQQQLAAGLQLPVNADGQQSPATEYRVEMNAQQQLFLNGNEVSTEQMSLQLQSFNNQGDIQVFLHRQLSAQQIQPLLSLLRQLHITQITLISESEG